jgi:hypothetical protein
MPHTSRTRVSTSLAPVTRDPGLVVPPPLETSPDIIAPGHPYRVGCEPSRPRRAGLLDRGDLATYWALVFLGLLAVLPALRGGGVWGSEPSLGLLLIGYAVRPLAIHYGRLLGRAMGRAG